MSLVEQAIARLRKQQGGAKVGPAEFSPKSSAREPLAEPLEDTANLANVLNVDGNALRAHGYLPDKDLDRQFADHFRRIKRPLIDKALSGNAAAGEPRIIMVASAVPGDGKTFTTINLAFSMAHERDISVLLVDSDVAKQHITEIFGLRDQKGLLDALVDENLDTESLVVPTNLRGLSILPAGRRVEGTAELLSSNRMRKIAASLCARRPRRIVLLDSPPLLITNEGRALLKIAGQVALVVRAGETPRHAVQAALELFDEKQAGGLILNQVTTGSTEGYYGYEAYGVDGDAA
jgi:exopolysaccharide/PEP-CTERM locus tyrosine autokinase